MLNSAAVIGLGFGDEGKGMVTSHLCSLRKNPLVVRFSGGHQAGHTVHYNGIKHVFSNLGAGTLHGAETYWSRFCTVDPVGLSNELGVLQKTTGSLDNVKLYINGQCPITTPFDIVFNHVDFKTAQDGTCGVGVGATIAREENHYHLHFSDLYNPTVLKIKLGLIKEYYGEIKATTNNFIKAVEQITTMDNIICVDYMPDNEDVIFEGSQGLLLDQNIGFFPHVTRSDTGMKRISREWGCDEVFYVTRAYQTRHGNGPMTNEDIPLDIGGTIHESNTTNEYQGEFRKTVLDLSLLQYAIEKDRLNYPVENLVITCMDQMRAYQLTLNGKLHTFKTEREFVLMIATTLFVCQKNVFLSRSPDSTLERFEI